MKTFVFPYFAYFSPNTTFPYHKKVPHGPATANCPSLSGEAPPHALSTVCVTSPSAPLFFQLPSPSPAHAPAFPRRPSSILNHIDRTNKIMYTSISAVAGLSGAPLTSASAGPWQPTAAPPARPRLHLRLHAHLLRVCGAWAWAPLSILQQCCCHG